MKFNGEEYVPDCDKRRVGWGCRSGGDMFSSALREDGSPPRSPLAAEHSVHFIINAVDLYAATTYVTRIWFVFIFPIYGDGFPFGFWPTYYLCYTESQVGSENSNTHLFNLRWRQFKNIRKVLRKWFKFGNVTYYSPRFYKFFNRIIWCLRLRKLFCRLI